jgi:MscS family membrane protein
MKTLFCLLVSVFFSVSAFAQTNVPASTLLDAERRDTLTFGLDKVVALQKIVFGIPLWKLLAAVIFLAIGVIAARVIDWLIQARLKKWAEKTTTRLDDILLQVIEGPIKVIVFVLFVQAGLEMFAWPAWIELWVRRGLYIAVAFSLTYMLLKSTDLIMVYWKHRAALRDDKSFDDQLFPIISKTIKIFLVIVAVLLTSQNLGLNITSVIASLSIGGLALGLAAQDTVANLFGAVAVFVDKPFRIGDVVKLGDVEGTVESMGLRSTRVRSPDGHLITVPNKTMGNATITNVTRRPNIKTTMNIGITYDTPSEKVQEAIKILNEVYRQHPQTADLIVSFNKFLDSALNFVVIHWHKPAAYKEYLASMQELNLTLKKRFDSAKINFAFPSQTVYLKQDSQWSVGQPAPDSKG